MRRLRLIGTGLVSATVASLCCVTPLLTLFAGGSGIASRLSWVGPLRPYLIGVTVLALGFAWYQKWKERDAVDECGCEPRYSFWNSKLQLGIATVLALAMLSIPYFLNSSPRSAGISGSNPNSVVEYRISGMSCESCEGHITDEVTALKGIKRTEVSYENGTAKVWYDNLQTSEVTIQNAINSTGYTVTEKINLSK